MKRRPLSIIIVCWLFIVAGCVSLVRGAAPLVRTAASGRTADLSPEEFMDAGIVSASGLVALLGGVFLLRGAGWARWLCVVWMGFHLVVGMLHSVSQSIVHCLLLGTILYLLFRAPGAAFFRRRREHGAGEGRRVTADE